MSSVQGPSSQPSSAPKENRGDNPAQKKEAEKSSDDFDSALKKKRGRGDQSKGEQMKGEKKDGLEDLFRQQANTRKKEGREDSESLPQQGEATKTLEARMGKTAEVAPADNKDMIDKIDKIADKIMVSTAADVKTVKIDFKDGVLPGTEVMIRKDAAGKLQIDFTTTSADSFNFLNKGEQALMDTLNRKMDGDVTVNIKMQGSGAEGDTGDGRSREEYMAEDEDDKDKKDD